MRFLSAVFITALLGVVYWLGATVFTDKIQQDISDRSSAAIAEVNPEIALDVDGRDVTLLGLVNTSRDRDVAGRTVDAVWGVRASRNQLEIRDGYDFQATHYKSEGLTIDGTVDSPEAVAYMREAIAPVVPKGTVATSGRPMQASPEKLALGAGALLMLMEGELEINEEQFVVRGTAEDDLVKEAIEQNLENRNADIDPLTLITEIAIADSMSMECRSRLNTLKDQNTVFFAVDSAVVTDEFSETTAAFASLLDVCPGIILVEAHADHDGSEDYNLKLSERRAQAVVDAIAAHGAAPDRLQLYFYGETRPVASNESNHDKTFNRRVEMEYVHQAPSANITLQQPIISSQSAE
jgi:outer membrane protein OmpA-like peptidoglycan-associated protein